MLSSLLLLSTLAVSAAQVSAQLNKPVANPSFYWPTVSNVLHPNLTPQSFSYSQWKWGLIPRSCKAAAEKDNLSPYDIEVLDVWLGDCDTKWIMCRHNKADVSQANFVERFGRLPVGMRDHVRHVVAVPCPGCIAGYASGQTGDVVLKGDVGNPSTASIWFHEVGHALDHQNGQYSTTQAWLNAYNADPAVPVAYAQTNQAENFAENMIVAAYDTLVPGGVQGMPNPQPAWWQVYNQYTQVKNGMGDKIRKIPGKRCSRKAGLSDTIVCMGPAASDSGNCAGVSQFKIAQEGPGNNGTAPPPPPEFGEVEYFDLKTGRLTSHKH